jgi:dihydroorotase
MYDLILKNGTLINEGKIFESDIAIKGDRIEKIASSIDAESKSIVDLEGKYVIPGLIDDQVHFREPGLTHKGEIATESTAWSCGEALPVTLKCLMLIQPPQQMRI